MDTEDTNGVLDLNSSPPPPPPPQPVGIYGWRKRCIYAFVLILMVVIIMNTALTIWILRVLHFSIDGMDHLKIGPKGFRLEGDAEFLQTAYINKIQSKKDQPLYVLSNKDVQLLSTDKDKKINSKLVVGKDSIEATCDSFKVQDNSGIVKMQLEGDKLYLGTNDASYPGSIQFGDSVSTPMIRSPPGGSLQIESQSSKVQIAGLGGVTVTSGAGDVKVNAKDDIFLTSTRGIIQIQSPSVFIQNLPKASKSLTSSTLPTSLLSSSFSSSSSSSTDIYQLCVCGNGKLYLALAKNDCRKFVNEICDD